MRKYHTFMTRCQNKGYLSDYLADRKPMTCANASIPTVAV